MVEAQQNVLLRQKSYKIIGIEECRKSPMSIGKVDQRFTLTNKYSKYLPALITGDFYHKAHLSRRSPQRSPIQMMNHLPQCSPSVKDHQIHLKEKEILSSWNMEFRLTFLVDWEPSTTTGHCFLTSVSCKNKKYSQ